MQNRKNIGIRIKKLRQHAKMSQSTVAEVLFISQAAYSLIENSHNGIATNHIIKLSDLYKVTTDFILKGDQKLISIKRENGFMPLINTYAHAGFLDNLNDEYFSDISDWFRIPGFDPSIEQSLFEVDGNSMVPTVLAGDILICQDQKNINNVLDGSLIIIIVNDKMMVKRMRHSRNNEHIVLENDNANSEEKDSNEFKVADIQKIWMVRGKLSSSIIPYHEIASKGKIKVLEESLQFLEKELYQMKAKINSLSSKN